MPNPESRLIRPAKTALVHKVIDINPPETPARAPLFGLKLSSTTRIAAGAACGVAFALIIALLAWPHAKNAAPAPVATAQAQSRPVAPAPAPVVTVVPPPPVPLTLNLPTAVEQGVVECSWQGNGKDRLTLAARNLTAKPLRVYVPAGQLLASTDSTIVTVQSHLLEFAPHAVLHQVFGTLATSSANRADASEYHLSAGPLPEIDKLLGYLASHPGASPGAVQTAALILTENLPLASFAKFNELTGGVALLPDTSSFKAETADIVSALLIIKDLGIDRPLAVTIDPQLRIEAMIDPAAHNLAVRYYGITDEWAYWKHELLNGDASTRHYALYGIARFYPAVALQMLPNWARQESVSPVFRLSAVQALAQTEKAEAIPILRGLENEFGGTSELGRAAHVAANYLDEQCARANRATAQNAARNPHSSALASAVIVAN